LAARKIIFSARSTIGFFPRARHLKLAKTLCRCGLLAHHFGLNSSISIHAGDLLKLERPKSSTVYRNQPLPATEKRYCKKNATK
jgi:hypothetical protein